MWYFGIAPSRRCFQLMFPTSKENVSLSDEICNFKKFLPSSLTSYLLLPFKNKSNGRRSNLIALSFRHVSIPISSPHHLFFRVRTENYQEKAQCHAICVMVFWLKGEKVLNFGGTLIVPCYKDSSFIFWSVFT